LKLDLLPRVSARLLAAALALGAVGCDDDDDEVVPPPPASTFNTFVLQQFAATADDTSPQEINGTTFTFSEDPNAFDSLFD